MTLLERPLRVPLVALVVFLACLAWSAWTLLRHEQAPDDARTSGAWLVWQVELEHTRFLAALDRYGATGDVAPGEVRNRFDILWSRLPVIREGMAAESLRELPGLGREIDELEAALERLAPLVEKLRGDDSLGRARIREILSPHASVLRTLSIEASALEREMIARDVHGRVTALLLWGMAALCSGVLLCAALIQQLRRSRRLEARHHAARREAEAARMQLHDAIKAVPEGIAVHDAEGRLLLANERYREMYGEPARRDLAVADAGAEAGAGSGESAACEPGEVRELGDDRWVRVVRREARGGSVVSVHVDVTELERRVQERTRDLLDANARLRLLESAVEASGDGVSIVEAGTAGHTIVYVNSAFERLTGYSAEEAVGRNPRFLQGGDSDQKGVRAIRAAVRVGRSGEAVLRNVRKSGEVFLNRLRVFPVRASGTREITHFIGVQEDVTAERRMVQVLQQARDEANRANEAKSIFLASMSHELRTPLNAIIGYSELLEDEARDAGNDAMVNDLQRIRSAGDHLLSLVNDLLDLSKIEADQVDVDVEVFAVGDVVDEITHAVKGLVERNGNELLIVWRRDPDEMRSDRVKLRQILFNLLGNAAKFTRDGRVALEIDAREMPGPQQRENLLVVFRVRDTGIGMDAQTRCMLFNPFVQGGREIGRLYGGTGLGLALSRRLCRLLGGDIEVESRLGEGSVFTVSIPARWAPADEPATEVKLQLPGAGGLPPGENGERRWTVR